MTRQQAIDILTDLRKDALRRRDDRGNQFSEVHFRGLSPAMRLYYQEQHEDAVSQVQAYELAIEALKEGMCGEIAKASETRPPPHGDGGGGEVEVSADV